MTYALLRHESVFALKLSAFRVTFAHTGFQGYLCRAGIINIPSVSPLSGHAFGQPILLKFNKYLM